MNTQLIFALFYSGTIFLFSCAGNDYSIEKEKLELEKEKLKLEQEKLKLEKEKEESYVGKNGEVKEELEKTSKNGEVKEELEKTSRPNYQGNQAKVTGQNVNMRASYSVESKVVGMLRYGESVTVIGQHLPSSNYSEAILKESTKFYDETYINYVFTLPKGKAVIVDGAVDGMFDNISFIDDKTKRKSYARISRDKLEFIRGEAWKNIVNSKGQSGWVLGRYIQSY
jgi:hypothetical protein